MIDVLLHVPTLPQAAQPVLGAVATVQVLIYQHRAGLGLSPLTASPHLRQAAMAHALDMAQRNYVAHRNPDGDSVGERVLAAGYLNRTASGENITAGYTSAEAAFQAWLNSPGHRGLIESTTYREFGVGYVFDAEDSNNVRLPDGNVGGPYFHYWVAIFANRMARQQTFPVVEVNTN